MSAPIRIDGFEAVFAADPDPWGTHTQRDEAVKREAIRRACGRTRGRTLELACGNGSNTTMLARRSLRLLAVDGAPSAVALTRAHVRAGAAGPRVAVQRRTLPQSAPDRPFDLIVIAELLYYLTPMDIVRLGQRLTLAPGGRLVLAHHHVAFPDTSSAPDESHDRLIAAMGPACRKIRTLRTSRWRVEAFLAAG